MRIPKCAPASYLLNCLAAVVLCSAAPTLFAAPQAPVSADIPVVKGGAGSCAADFVVTDVTGKGIYDAKIHVLIKYGFMGLHKLDLTVGTNYQGKARVEGMPEKIKNPAAFTVSYGGQNQVLEYDPYDNCQSKHQVTLTAGATPTK